MRSSLLVDTGSGGWLPQFGQFDLTVPNSLAVSSGTPVGENFFHAEAHYGGVLGADFAYSATVSAKWTQDDLSADLQFRISDEGRYGVRLQAGTVTFYRFMLEDRQCDPNADVIAHCSMWPAPNENPADDPLENPINPSGSFDLGLTPLRVTVVAEGSHFTVSFGTRAVEVGRFEVDDASLGVGRFGVYARAKESTFDVRFSDVSATTEATSATNFALLYSTPGYDIDGTKRALVRTLNDIDAQDFDDTGSSFTITNAAGETKIDQRQFGSPILEASSGFRRAFGMQFLEADFTDLHETGSYTLDARVATSTGIRELSSNPFEIRQRLVTETMLWPLTVLNAQARRAADDDFRRNWEIESGIDAWSVGLDGAFVADRADDVQGATLRRVFDCGNSPLAQQDFRFVARITIVAGCDAQLQFRINDDERWGVTLQAGDAGGCQHGTGPGAVRLHREGSAVPGNFVSVDSHLMDGAPFKVGRAYDVEVRASGPLIEAFLDGVRVIHFPFAPNPRPGGFALKAWASTVRFGHAKVWARAVGLSRPRPGVWIPYDRTTGLSSQGFTITTPDQDETIGAAPSAQDLAYPFAAQQHGYNDCNNFIGEITSHSVFLSALMDVWVNRAQAAIHPDKESLRDAILTAVLYLNELSEQGNRSSTFAHQEPGRGALVITNKILTTQFAMYGLSSFADKGGAVDDKHTHIAFELATDAWHWLENNGGGDASLDSIVARAALGSIVALRLGRAAERQGKAANDWFDKARENAETVLGALSEPGAMATLMRPTLRSIPWFEGVYELFAGGPLPLDEPHRIKLSSIAEQLVALANDPANGFCVIPQSDDDRQTPDPTQPIHNWEHLAELPLAVKPIPQPPVGDWYTCLHFATAAADCVYIGRLVGEEALKRLATGNLYWALGLNPGIPTTKTAPAAPTRAPWSAASFVYNGPGTFARTIEGYRTRTSSAKSWLAEWEKTTTPPTASRHRETWWIDPVKNEFQSIVNGHVLRESQWHYWNIGVAGWVSGETFMLNDGSFLRAAIALEDWHTGALLPTANPYDLTKPQFFDTTHLDRASTKWRFDDPDHTAAAEASRMATDFGGGKGFGGSRLTGHHKGERVGALCLPVTGTIFVDISDKEIADTKFPFDDINTAGWAQVARSATEIAATRGFGAGFFTGHQVPGKHGWIGIDATLIDVFDVDDNTVAQSQWAFTDINTVHWAQAARLATDICIKRNFLGGFFTGHQIPNGRQIAALRVT